MSWCLFLHCSHTWLNLCLNVCQLQRLPDIPAGATQGMCHTPAFLSPAVLWVIIHHQYVCLSFRSAKAQSQTGEPRVKMLQQSFAWAVHSSYQQSWPVSIISLTSNLYLYYSLHLINGVCFLRFDTDRRLHASHEDLNGGFMAESQVLLTETGTFIRANIIHLKSQVSFLHHEEMCFLVQALLSAK